MYRVENKFEMIMLIFAESLWYHDMNVSISVQTLTSDLSLLKALLSGLSSHTPTRLPRVSFRAAWCESTPSGSWWSWREARWGNVASDQVFTATFTWRKPVLCPAGDLLLPPHPVHRDRRGVSGEVQHRGVVSDRHQDIRWLHQAGTITGRVVGGARHDIHMSICVCLQVQAAESVLVVGGGSTGVEMAAEIKTEYPDKKVRTDWPQVSQLRSTQWPLTSRQFRCSQSLII